MSYKLGSLFDGSGGFPLAGALCDIEPTWAAEVEPYPIAVTRSRFPRMTHLGDISKVDGAEIEPVDIITFGSPCQDLSVAGKRAGLKHEANGDEETTRSGLFMEAVRIIKEMREATNGEYPSFALWENVPGAFSSNNGEDFRIVLEELVRIVEPYAAMPRVPKAGWAYADSFSGSGWSLAYRVFDAQYWGVPQRRRRIHLVLDLRGERAREILFEREGVRGYFAQGRTPWQAITADASDGIGADDRAGEAAGAGDGGLDAVGFMRQLSGVEAHTELSPTLLAAMGESGNNKPCAAYTMKIRSGVAVDSNGKAAGKGALVQTEKAGTLSTVQDQYLFQPKAYSFDSLASNSMKSANPHSGCREVEVAKTLDTSDPNPSKNQGGIAIVEPTGIIDNIGGQAEYGKVTGINGTLRAGGQGAIAYAVADKRVTIGLNGETDKAPTLIARMETATGTTQDNLLVCMAEPLPIHDQATRFAGKHGDKADGKGNGLGIGAPGDPMNTLTAGDRHAVAFGLDRASFNQGQNAKFDFSVQEEQQPTLTARGPGAVCCTTGSYMQTTEEVSPTLMARDWKDPTCVCRDYIVRRLTPTECARLQGFADRWGDIDRKDSLTDAEYRFWLEVRNTHARINGRAEKDYSPAQMLTWYNKLQTDSAEYKMWGNGIALPPALYCLQGMAEALEKAAIDDWMN